MSRCAWVRLAAGVVAGFVVLTSGVPVAQAGEFIREDSSDFDCDGIRDLINFSPDTVDGAVGAGSVTITYSRGGQDHITQATAGVPGDPEPNDLFGWRYTTYDGDQDGCDELVVGVPLEDIGSERDAGMVTVIPGSPSGLVPADSIGYTQDSPGFPGVAEALDSFGLALSAGTTQQGEPFLLIGSPGESGPDATTRSSGLVHYLRGGTVTMFHQDSPGVSGAREVNDSFGQTLAASDRYFVVGSPAEGIEDNEDGMVHVFSHTLSGGRPSQVAAFHQDTAGISGEAEGGDRFGWSVSVLPFQPSGGAPVGALVAVGVQETVGDTDNAGMAHLVHVSPAGGLSQLAAVSQNTPGVTGAPEEGDYLGYNVVVANLDPDSTVATPQTAVWAAAVPWEESGLGLVGAAHVFPPGWRAGTPDIWLKEGTFGLGDVANMSQLRASSSHLHVGGDALDGPCHAVAWQNLLSDASLPVVTRAEPCAHRPGLR